ncbi:MAG: acetylglutamate kinase [Actinobacteria bacterium]|nr:acetylglutamate kinase [Actinomycetota bacterium]
MIVIKFGGHAMTDEGGLFSRAVSAVIDMGEQCVIVHGGGPQISAALDRAGLESEFIGGLRVTTPQSFEIIQSTLSGEVLRTLVGQLRDSGINAVGLTGRDGGLLVAEKLTSLADGMPAQLGQVGSVIRVDATVLRTLLEAGFVPVVAPIAVLGDESDENSKIGLNVNADLAAASIAGELRADVLLFLTDVPGIYRNWPDTSSMISSIHVSELRAIQNDFDGGMAPKVQACLLAIEKGAESVRVIDGTDPESFGLALRGIGGTLVTK